MQSLLCACAVPSRLLWLAGPASAALLALPALQPGRQQVAAALPAALMDGPLAGERRLAESDQPVITRQTASAGEQLSATAEGLAAQNGQLREPMARFRRAEDRPGRAGAGPATAARGRPASGAAAFPRRAAGVAGAARPPTRSAGSTTPV